MADGSATPRGLDPTGRGSSAPMTTALERNEDVLRYDPASGLGSLARETGGFLIRDTNDISAGLRRVEEELGAYYLLSYAPKQRDVGRPLPPDRGPRRAARA